MPSIRATFALWGNMSEIVGLRMQVNGNGVPVPTSERAAFPASEVKRLGKMCWYGSQACVRYVVEATDGTMLSVRVADQGAEAQAWIKRVGRKIMVPQASRSVGYDIRWASS